MSPEKSPKKQHPLPSRVDFATWKREVKPHLRAPTREGQTLQRWMEKQAAYLTLIGDTEGAQEDSLLEYVYRITRLQLASESERRAHVSAISMLENLHSQIEETVKELSKFSSSIVPEDGGRRLLSPS